VSEGDGDEGDKEDKEDEGDEGDRGEMPHAQCPLTKDKNYV
jgi:hypothetical protein